MLLPAVNMDWGRVACTHSTGIFPTVAGTCTPGLSRALGEDSFWPHAVHVAQMDTPWPLYKILTALWWKMTINFQPLVAAKF